MNIKLIYKCKRCDKEISQHVNMEGRFRDDGDLAMWYNAYHPIIFHVCRMEAYDIVGKAELIGYNKED